MNLPGLISFLLLGVISIITQLTLQRELINAFYGNELFIGVVLASWMLWTAVGAKLCHPRPRLNHSGVNSSGDLAHSDALDSRFRACPPAVWRGNDRLFILVIFLLGFVFFGELVLLRFVKNIVGFPGEVPNLLYGLLVAFASPAPICLLLGAWWTSGIGAMFAKGGSLDSSRSYLVETIGFVVGGIAFGLALVRSSELMVAGIVIVLCLAFLFLLKSGPINPCPPAFWRGATTSQNSLMHALPFLAAILFLAYLMHTPLLDKLNLDTTSLRYKGQTLLESVNSNYGNISVTKFNEQLNFFENGTLLGTTEKVQSTEELVHLALLQHKAPKNVLLVGGGLFGEIAEIKKHPVDEIYYVELDPELINVGQRYIPGEPKVHVVIQDAYYYLKNTTNKFDVIIMNLPAPSTEIANRFWTEEFFQIAERHLNPGGIFCDRLPSSPSTLNRNLEELATSIYKTLTSVFQQVIFLPEDSLIFLSSPEDVLTYDPKVLTARFRERGIKTNFLPPEYFTFRLTTDRIDQMREVFERNKGAPINRLFEPAAYFYQNLFWLDLFYPRLESAYRTVATSNVTIVLLLVIFASVLLFSSRRGSSCVPLFSVGVAGFSLMALEMVVIFAYQAIVGYLYYRLAILIAALMLGMAVAVVLGMAIPPKEAGRRNLVISHSLIFLFSVIFAASLPLFSRAKTTTLPETFLIVFAIASGFFGAIIFPIANRLYYDFRKDPSAVYSADLFGSCLGALLPSLILIPAFGLFYTLAFIAATNLLTAIFFVKK